MSPACGCMAHPVRQPHTQLRVLVFQPGLQQVTIWRWSDPRQHTKSLGRQSVSLEIEDKGQGAGLRTGLGLAGSLWGQRETSAFRGSSQQSSQTVLRAGIKGQLVPSLPAVGENTKSCQKKRAYEGHLFFLAMPFPRWFLLSPCCMYFSVKFNLLNFFCSFSFPGL